MAGEAPAEEDVAEAFDEHGFAVRPHGDTVGDSLRDYARWFEAKALRRCGRFERQRRSLARPGAWAAVRQASLKALLRKGVPTEHRPEVWWSILGCEARRALAPLDYAQSLAKAQGALDEKPAETIERDLQRTFPNHRRFRQVAGQAALRNVLLTFAHHAPRVQYCQGLNFIAGMFLVVFEDEERAFWALVCSLEALGVEGYYTEGMKLLRVDMQALAVTLQAKCPKVSQAFAAAGVDLTSICSEWLLTWFARCLPVPTVLRVWDTLFFEGFKVLFRVAIGIFKLVEPEILRCQSFEDVMERAKDWPRCMVKHNELLKASFKGVPGLRRKDLMQAREDAMFKVEQEDEERGRRRQQARLARQAPAPAARGAPQTAVAAR